MVVAPPATASSTTWLSASSGRLYSDRRIGTPGFSRGYSDRRRTRSGLGARQLWTLGAPADEDEETGNHEAQGLDAIALGRDLRWSGSLDECATRSSSPLLPSEMNVVSPRAIGRRSAIRSSCTSGTSRSFSAGAGSSDCAASSGRSIAYGSTKADLLRRSRGRSRDHRHPTEEPGLRMARGGRRRRGRRIGVKEVTLVQAEDHLKEYLRAAEKEEILITRNGKPAGMLIGFASEDDWFDYQLENDPRFLRRAGRYRSSGTARAATTPAPGCPSARRIA